jgi:hypothetical protein
MPHTVPALPHQHRQQMHAFISMRLLSILCLHVPFMIARRARQAGC